MSPHVFVAHESEVDLCTTCGHGQTHRLHDTEPKAPWFMVTQSPKKSYLLGGIWAFLTVVQVVLRVADDSGPSWFEMLYIVLQAAASGYFFAAGRAHADFLRKE